MATCKTTGEKITNEENNYREGKKNDLLKRLQLQLGKTRDQVLDLFRSYNKNTQKKN